MDEVIASVWISSSNFLSLSLLDTVTLTLISVLDAHCLGARRHLGQDRPRVAANSCLGA